MIGVFAILIVSMLLVAKFCKRKALKAVLSFIIALTALYCVILSVDANRVYALKQPIFAKSVETTQIYSDYNKETYKGLGYRAEIVRDENDKPISVTMYFLNKVIDGWVT